MLLYNVDESGVTVVTKLTGVVTQVGWKAVYSIAAAEKGEPHTIMMCGSAHHVICYPNDYISLRMFI